MPVKKEREYRTLVAPLAAQSSGEKRLQSECYVEGYAKTGETTGKGVFTIVEVKAGQGASVGWGRLKSGAGWISLDYATRLA